MESESSKRAKNFTDLDRNLLFELAIQYKPIIENKRTDGVSVRQKNEVWMEITNKYNGNCQTGPRNVKQLRALYDTIKKRAKKNLHKDKRDLYKAGGENFIPNSIDSSATSFEEINSGNEDITPVENINVIPEAMQVAGPITKIHQETEDVAGTSTEFRRMSSIATQAEESCSAPHVNPPTLPTKKSKIQSIEQLTKIIVDRKFFKDKLNADVQRKKEEILDVEKTVKENQLTATNIDVLIKQAELKIKEKEIEIKEKEIQLKNEELLHSRRIQEIELELKEKELQMKRWEYAMKEDAFKRNHIT